MPFYGHTLPTLGTVEQLVRHGITVGYVNSPIWQTRIEATGASFLPYKSYRTNPSLFYDISHALNAAYSAADSAVFDYDAVVYEAYCDIGKLIADKYGKPSIRLFTSFAWNDESFELLSREAPFWKPFRSPFCRFFISKISAPGSKFHFPYGNLVSDILKNIPELNITYLPREFQVKHETFDSRFEFVGTSIYNRTDSDIKLPDDGKPLIYISLGTVSFGELFYKKCIKAFTDADVNVIMSVGKSFPIKKLGILPPNISAYSFVPQFEVLKHTACFITHGGMNSVSEAIYFAVPMLVFPQGTEQHATANHIERLKLGKRIDGVKMSASALEEAALNLIADDIVRASVIKMSKADHIAGGAEKSAKIIENYLISRV